MTENLFVLGNGESRKDIDVELLKVKVKSMVAMLYLENILLMV